MSELTNPRSVDKLKRNHTYSDTPNYWAPLAIIFEDEEFEDNTIKQEERASSAIDDQPTRNA